MSRAASILMTADEIRAELGWSDDMVRRLLRIPDAPSSMRGKHKCDRYNRDRVLAAAQTTVGRAAKREWDETLRDPTPDPGWTTRLGDIGRLLGISAVAVGKILELLGYRSEGSVTDSAVRAGCGVRRWNGFALFYDCTLTACYSLFGRRRRSRHIGRRQRSRGSDRQTERERSSRGL